MGNYNWSGTIEAQGFFDSFDVGDRTWPPVHFDNIDYFINTCAAFDAAADALGITLNKTSRKYDGVVGWVWERVK